MIPYTAPETRKFMRCKLNVIAVNLFARTRLYSQKIYTSVSVNFPAHTMGMGKPMVIARIHRGMSNKDTLSLPLTIQSCLLSPPSNGLHEACCANFLRSDRYIFSL